MQRPEWRLPGPNRFAQAIAADLEDGRLSIAILPASGFPEGLQGAVRDLLPDVEVNQFRLEELAGGRGRVVDVLYQRLGLRRARHGGHIDVSGFARHSELQRRLIWVDGRGASAGQVESWSDFLEQYAAVAAEVPIHRRTVFATLWKGRHASLAPDSVSLLACRWWWGAVTPLDTEVFVSELAREREWQPAFAETVSEVAGFDLGLAARLVEEWDGVPHSLAPLLGEYRFTSGDGGQSWSAKPSPRPQPPRESVAAWSEGLVNAWGARDPHPHPCYLCTSKPETLHRLIWLGQVRSLMPRIEIERQVLAEWVYTRRNRLPSQWKGRDIRSLEVGSLAAIFATSPFRSDHKREPLARWLHQARNAIAHLEILDANELDKGRRMLRREIGLPTF